MKLVSALSSICALHTLGPTGTNCERAAWEWLRRNGPDGKVFLYSTLEKAIKQMPYDPEHALLGCVVYPLLNEIVFNNLDRLELLDCLILPTHDMLLAQVEPKPIETLATHPAPHALGPSNAKRIYVDSNVVAAELCAQGKADACITTRSAAEALGLQIMENYGAVPMGFTIHGHRMGAVNQAEHAVLESASS